MVCAPPHSHSGPSSASLAFSAAQQPGSPHPLLIPQSHQARFLEDAISTTSTHRARALCSSRARRVIDLVRRSLPGSPSSPPCSAIIALLLPASPLAASCHPTQKQTLPTLCYPVKHTSPPSLHLKDRPSAVHFPLLSALLTEWGSEERSTIVYHRHAHTILINTHKMHMQTHTTHRDTHTRAGICPPSKLWQQRP